MPQYGESDYRYPIVNFWGSFSSRVGEKGTKRKKISCEWSLQRGFTLWFWGWRQRLFGCANQRFACDSPAWAQSKYFLSFLFFFIAYSSWYLSSTAACANLGRIASLTSIKAMSWKWLGSASQSKACWGVYQQACFLGSASWQMTVFSVGCSSNRSKITSRRWQREMKETQPKICKNSNLKLMEVLQRFS